MADWTIYGNDDAGENLFGDYETFPNTHIANVNAWTSYGGGGLCQRVKCEGNTKYTLSFANTSSLFRISASSTNDVPTENNPVIVQRLVNTTNSNSETFTTPNNAKFIIVQISFDEQELLNSAMLVKGSTAPDHYIPYQKGVGERTENLFDGTIVQGVWNSLTGQVPRIVSSSTRLATSTMLAVDATETYNIKIFSATSDMLVVAIKLLNSAKEQFSDTGWAGVSTSISGADYIVVNIQKFDGSVITPADAAGITITKGSTAPSTYVPFGYEIPILCEHNISEDVTYDADKMLGFDGEPISYPPYQTTSDFIAVTQQKIVISGTSVSSMNKLIRVCQYDENKIYLGRLDSTLYGAIDYSFTFTLGPQAKFIKYSLYTTDTDIIAKEVNDYTFYIGDIPLTEGETVSKTSTGVDIELFNGENTVSTSLYNKPEMTINYPHQVDIDPYINSKIPTALKNPYALTINYNTTKSFDYDGSTAKSLSIKAGDNITLSGDTDGNITINGTANTWTALVGATSSSNGSVGYINAIPPKEGYNTKFFRADGTWAIPDYIPNTDEKVKQTNNTNNSSYRILLSNSANDTEETNGVKKSAYLLFNPNSKTLTTTNLSITKINDVTVGSTPKFTDTTYTFANGTNSFTVTPVGGTAQTVTVTPSITNNITGSGTSGYLAKFNGTNTITKGP